MPTLHSNLGARKCGRDSEHGRGFPRRSRFGVRVLLGRRRLGSRPEAWVVRRFATRSLTGCVARTRHAPASRTRITCVV